MIKKITKEQQNLFNELQENWRNLASTPIDKKNLFKSIKLIYKKMGFDNPFVIIGDSPISCLFLSLFAKKPEQLHSQLTSQLYSQLHSQLYSQLDSQLDSQLYSQLTSQLITVWWGVWACYYEFGKKIGINFNKNKYKLFMNFIKEVGYIIPFEKICFVSKKPTLSWNGNFLHNEKDKAVKYVDNWGWYALNGVIVPEWLVLKSPQEIDPLEVLRLSNAQQRAEGIRKIGVEKLWYKCCKKVLDKQGDYELGLLPIDNKGGECLYLKMKNPSVPELWHVEGIGDMSIKTIEQAINWRKPPKMKEIPVDDVNGEEYYQQGDVVVWPKNAKSLKTYPKILT